MLTTIEIELNNAQSFNINYKAYTATQKQLQSTDYSITVQESIIWTRWEEISLN